MYGNLREGPLSPIIVCEYAFVKRKLTHYLIDAGFLKKKKASTLQWNNALNKKSPTYFSSKVSPQKPKTINWRLYLRISCYDCINGYYTFLSCLLM